MVGVAVGNTCRRVLFIASCDDEYAREEEIVVLIVGKEVDDVLRSNMETWRNENSGLSDTVS